MQVLEWWLEPYAQDHKIKYIGVTIRENLRWNTHVSNVFTSLISVGETYIPVLKTSRRQCTKDWSIKLARPGVYMVVQFEIHKV